MSAGINIEQRSIILISFPYTDLSGAKKRPSLVLSSLEFNMKSEDVICCLITSNPDDIQHAIKISNRDLEKGYLEFESKVKPYRIFTVNRKLIYKVLGKLNLSKSKSIVEEINKIINIKQNASS